MSMIPEIEKLPDDYEKWSSTVLFFDEKEGRIDLYALDSENCTMYGVTSYSPPKGLYWKLGYTAGNKKAYFIGDATFDEENGVIYSLDVKVYDLVTSQWVENVPTLKAAKPAPFVFFVDNRLYVLSGGLSYEEPHFEMLDTVTFEEWVLLSEPSFTFTRTEVIANNHTKITDYSNKKLYVRLINRSSYDCELYGYNLDEESWYTNWKQNPLEARTANLLKANWSHNSVIVENHLYGFQMYKYSTGLRAVITIRDLEHGIRVHNSILEPDFVDHIYRDDDPPLAGTKIVDISSLVAPDVLHDTYADGYLVYLRESKLFFLVILFGDNYQVFTCTFDLQPRTTFSSFSSSSSIEEYIVTPICTKLQPVELGVGHFACEALG